MSVQTSQIIIREGRTRNDFELGVTGPTLIKLPVPQIVGIGHPYCSRGEHSPRRKDHNPSRQPALDLTSSNGH